MTYKFLSKFNKKKKKILNVPMSWMEFQRRFLMSWMDLKNKKKKKKKKILKCPNELNGVSKKIPNELNGSSNGFS
jgi:hypothetical protein